MAADIPANATPEELKTLKEQAELEKATFEALKGAAEAKRQYQTALDGAANALNDESAVAKTAKDVADAKKAAADAQKSQSDAELAALKAKFGDFSAAPFTGAADVTSAGAGAAEGHLLASKAVNELAATLAQPINALEATEIILCTPTTIPEFQALLEFKAQLLGIEHAVKNANAIAPVAPKPAFGPQGVAAVGLGLEAVSKLLSFAKTDFKFMGIEVSLTDAALVQSLAGKLTDKKVFIPVQYQPQAFDSANAILDDVTKATELSQEALRGRNEFAAEQQQLEKQLAAAPNAPGLKDKVDKAKAAAVMWKATSDTIEAWLKKLSTADDKGSTQLASVLRQSMIRKQLDEGAALVVVQLHKISGSAYTKKNLWSSLGANPFYVMGGAVGGYIAYAGDDGHVLSSGTAQFHGGYRSVSSVEVLVNSANNKEEAEPNKKPPSTETVESKKVTQ